MDEGTQFTASLVAILQRNLVVKKVTTAEYNLPSKEEDK